MMNIPIEQIRPNPRQPRQRIHGLEELAFSIAERGLLEPVMVRPANGGYELIHGERRWRAAKLAGLHTIPAVVREATDEEVFELAIVENLQREDLTPMEEARAYQHLQGQGHTQAEIARTVGKSQSYVAHKLRLLQLPRPLTYFLEKECLTEGHLRQLLRVKNILLPDLKREFANLEAWHEEQWKQDPEAAQFLLIGLRPEESVSMVEPTTDTIAACDVFAEYVTNHKPVVPQWVCVAFWWACLAVDCPLSVANLALGLDRWQERHQTALWYWMMWGNETPSDEEEQAIWWGFWADLRHSGSLTEATRRAKDPEARHDVLTEHLPEQLMVAGSYLLPSRMQS